ncbi:MAG: dihydroneopterin aldolase [Thermaerobacter sp.]|nr:dihydroneopterin aldolase [Thermaerobacter sp.]
MRKIALRGLVFYGRHGAYRHERGLGQPFYVDIEIVYDFRGAAGTDAVEDAVDYRHVYRTAREIFEGPSLHLVETLAERTAQAILARFPEATRALVHVRKPHAPLGGPAEGVEALAEIGRDD